MGATKDAVWGGVARWAGEVWRLSRQSAGLSGNAGLTRFPAHFTLQAKTRLIRQKRKAVQMHVEKGRVLIELPVEWMRSKIASEAVNAATYFSSMVTAANELGWTIETVPSVMYSDASRRFPRSGQLCISYHTHGEEPNVWHVKEGYLPGYFTFDRMGYSGFSELSRHPDRFMSDINCFDESEAEAIILKNQERFLDGGISKYAQPEKLDRGLPECYIFFPLQTSHDSVQIHSRFDQRDAIRALASLCEERQVHLVLKRHPYCRDAAIAETLREVTCSPWVILVDGPINTLVSGAIAVFGGNSGVLFEALLAGKPVYSYAASDYEIATHQVGSLSEIGKVFAIGDKEIELRRRFLGWYLSHYCFEASNVIGLIERLKCIQIQKTDFFAENLARLEIKKIYAGAELFRRSAIAQAPVFRAHSPRDVLTLNMLRDAYNVGAAAKFERIRRCYRVSELLELLPANRRQVLGREYYEKLHRDESGYIENNWLVEYLPDLARIPLKHVVEIGCGNGKFLQRAAFLFDQVTGCDWVTAPTLPLELPNVNFKQIDLMRGGFPKGDLVCSADVLEHIPVENLPHVLSSLVSAAPLQFHAIACYDDGHSHQSVFDPSTWLALFRLFMGNAWIFDVSARFNDSTRIVCVITNLPFESIGDPLGVA